MNSPLQLEHYFFERMSCIANSAITFEQVEEWRNGDDSRFKLRVGLANNPDIDREYQVRVEIETNDALADSSPYALDFSAVGFFVVDPEFEHDDIERLVRTNGASVLFSAMRELVTIVTSRAPWGPVMLPTVNFRLLAPSESENSDSAE